MYFDPSYFKEEERDGFIIKPIIKRAWAAQLEVLKVIDEICKRHNINYFAEYGTLLGAVRHQGFVPWDDDIDIGMRRKDFVTFQHYAKQELPEGFKLLSASDKNHDQLIARVINGINITTDPSYLERFHGCPYAVGIDIFILDNIPLTKEEEEVQLNLLSLTYTMEREWDNDAMTTEEKLDTLHEIEKLCKIEFDHNQSIPQQLLILCDKISALYWDIEPKEISVMLSVAVVPEFRFPIECFDSYVEVPFDVTTIPVPIGYDRLLTVQFGENYMTPKHYHNHNYPFFKEQQEILFEKADILNIQLPDYLKEVF